MGQVIIGEIRSLVGGSMLCNLADGLISKGLFNLGWVIIGEDYLGMGHIWVLAELGAFPTLQLKVATNDW